MTQLQPAAGPLNTQMSQVQQKGCQLFTIIVLVFIILLLYTGMSIHFKIIP